MMYQARTRKRVFGIQIHRGPDGSAFQKWYNTTFFSLFLMNNLCRFFRLCNVGVFAVKHVESQWLLRWLTCMNVNPEKM